MKSIGCEPDNLDPLERRFLWSAWSNKSGYKGDGMHHFGLAFLAGPMESERKDLTPKNALRRSPSRGALGETLIIRTHTIEPLGTTSGIAQREKEDSRKGAELLQFRSWPWVLVYGSLHHWDADLSAFWCSSRRPYYRIVMLFCRPGTVLLMSELVCQHHASKVACNRNPGRRQQASHFPNAAPP